MPPIRALAACLLTVSLVQSSPALAHQCPQLMARVDQGLGGGELTDEDREFVVTLRRQGEELHEEGDHDDAIAVLEHALELLGDP